MPDYTGTIFNDLYDFPGLNTGDVLDALGGQDTLDATGTNNDYLYDLENNVISVTNGTFLSTIRNFEEVIGGNGDDILIGNNTAAINNLNGGNGDDTVSSGSAGIRTGDVYAGGAGTNVLDLSNLSGDHTIDMNTGDFMSGGQTATISGFQEIIAGSGDDFIRERSGVQSTIHGGLGDDTLATASSGVGGGEVFNGGGGTDMFDFSNQTVGYVADLVNGVFDRDNGGFATTLTSIEEVSAGSGNDSLIAGSVDAAVYGLFGNGGDDTIIARDGTLRDGDTYDGGTGTDTFNFASFTGDFRLNTATGLFRSADGTEVGRAAGFETVVAGSGNDVIGGNDEAQLIMGNSGNDIITGGDGNDTLDGGNDRDVLRADDGNDSVIGGSGNDFGSGGDGMDTLLGGTGDDTMVGGDGADSLNGGDDNDALAGNNGNDTVIGGGGADRLYGEAGFDYLEGGNGNDRLEGGAQADNLLGGTGADTMLGGSGFDRVFGGDGDDLAYGGTESDALFGQDDHDRLFGQNGDDRLYGGNGHDFLDGGNNNDELYGGAGFDTIVGGGGNDFMTGNFNADVFLFSDFGPGFGQDTITDFDALNGFERIDLSRVSTINNLFDLFSNHISTQGADVVINAGGGNTIRLLNTDFNDLDATDFIF